MVKIILGKEFEGALTEINWNWNFKVEQDKKIYSLCIHLYSTTSSTTATLIKSVSTRINHGFFLCVSHSLTQNILNWQTE